MTRVHLSHEDAMTLWRARDLYRVQAVLKGLLLLFWSLQLVMYVSFGYWWLGLLAVGLQWAMLWCLRWGLRWLGRWAHQGLWWCIDHVQSAVQSWQREHRR
jgi:hypothetical protein